jgi:ribulose-phosphate 3-epimerase
MSNAIKIAPSLLAADPLCYGSEVQSVEYAGADLHHVDVMDGHFVPNLSFGLPIVRALKKLANIPLDVHIMVSNPDAVALDYVEAGADYLVFPIESSIHPHRLIHAIKAKGAKAGVAVNPGTSLTLLEPLLEDLDLVNVMSVNPGFGGQSFIPAAVDRVARLKRMIESIGSGALIEVDGGVNAQTAKPLKNAGVDVLVAGTYVYGARDRKSAIASLR